MDFFNVISLREKFNDQRGSKFDFWKVSDDGGSNAYLWGVFKQETAL